MIRATSFSFSIVALGCCLAGDVGGANRSQSRTLNLQESWVDQVQWLPRSDGSQSLVVEALSPKTPIKHWGLRTGDRVVSFAGTIPDSLAELRLLSEQLSPEDWELTVLRNDRLVRLAAAPPLESANEEVLPQPFSNGLAGGVEVLPGEHYVLPADPMLPSATTVSRLDVWVFGFEMITFRPEFWSGWEAPVISGALVEKVLHGSLADQAGLSAGAIIVAVDGRRIDTANELADHLGAKKSALPFTLLAYHGRELRRHVFTDGSEPEPATEQLPAAEDELPAPATELLAPPIAPAGPTADIEIPLDELPAPPLRQPTTQPERERAELKQEVEQVQAEIDRQLRALEALETRLQQLQQQLNR